MSNLVQSDKVCVAIHQPNFFPWLGYFDKIKKSDKFIILDNVQIPKKGGSWINRVKILTKSSEKWLTAPLDRSYSGFKNINEVNYRGMDWRNELINQLIPSYQKHTYFEVIIEDLIKIIEFASDNVADYNLNCVKELCLHLEIDTSNFRLASDLDVDSKSNKRLCDLVKNVGGETYLYGGGAGGYQDESIFSKHGINLIPQNFIHPVYTQCGLHNFISGLSIIDAAMNLGWGGVKQFFSTGPCQNSV